MSRSSLLSNYLKMAARTFYRNRTYTTFNLLGLATGFAVFIFAAVYVYFETHYESFHSKADRIYRATYHYSPPGGFDVQWARIPFDYINELPSDVPGVTSLIRFQNHERKYIRIGEEKFRPSNVYVTDKEVFGVFDFKLLAGNAATALAEPNSVVLTQSLARKYFGTSDPMGKDVYVIGDFDNSETLHHVTGVMADLPANTHLPVDMLISFRNKEERSGWAYTYILLDDRTTIAQIEQQMPSFVKKYSKPDEAKSDAIAFQPLTDIHLHSNLAREIVPNSKMLYVEIIGFAGLFILVIAVINFMNLSSAMALGRAKEIGMRKVMGANRAQLISYILTESVANNLAALAIGGAIAYLAFPILREFVAIQFLPSPLEFVVALILMAVVCGLAAGVYPLMLLVSLRPMEVVKTTKVLSFAGREGAFSLKRVMVTLQFCISILLLGSALIAYEQLQFITGTSLGSGKDQIIAIPAVPDKVKEGFTSFRNQLSTQKGIVSVSACMEVPSREIRDAGPVLIEGVNSDPSKAPVIDIQVVDHDLAPLLGLELVGGRNLSPPPPGAGMPKLNDGASIQKYLLDQPREYLINETAMRKLGWQSPQDALGRRISWSIGDMALAPGPIVGVVRDFHQETLKNKIDPMIMVCEPVWLRTFLIKAEAGQVPQAVENVQATWNKQFPFYPMEYFFLDDLYNNLYKGERTQLQLLFMFSGLAILIAFIGLVGLVAYALKTRMKEVAVRKVLGATIRDLIALMSREYIAVILIGSLVAIPLSIVGVQEWLAGFAYHIDISPSPYLVTVALIVALLFATIAVQTLKTSRINPADTLRDE